MPSPRPREELSLLESGLFADALVHCQGRVWKVHRSILITQSCFFDKAFTGDFEEATSREINLAETDADTVDRAIRWMYGDDTETGSETPQDGSIVNLEKDVRLWVQADFLQMPKLLEEISDRLRNKFIRATHELTSFQNKKNSTSEKPKLVDTWINKGDNTWIFLKDIAMAISLAYKIPAARELQLQATACLLSIQGSSQEMKLRELIDIIPPFKDDVFSSLIDMHFQPRRVAHPSATHHLASSVKPRTINNCSSCGYLMDSNELFTICPWSHDNWRWCSECGLNCIAEEMEKFVDASLKRDRENDKGNDEENDEENEE